MNYKKTIVYFLSILILVSGVIAYIFLKPEKSVINTNPEFSLSASALFSEYSTNEETANKKFLGKIIQVKGSIRELLNSDSDSKTIILETEDPFGGISCVLDSRSNSSIEKLHIGTTVEIKGKCSGLLIDVVINKCVLIN